MKNDSQRALTPKIRFPEFLNTPGWEMRPLGDLYEFGRTNNLSRDKLNYKDGTVKNIHYGDIHTRFKPLFDITREIVPFVNSMESADETEPESLCGEGDLVFADASEDLLDVGKCIELVVLNGQSVQSGTHTILAKRKREELVIGFGGLLFQSDRMRAQIRKEAQGAKVFGISPTRLADVEVCFPPTAAEQHKIVDCLKSLDGVITAQRLKLEALRAHKKGLMQRLLPRDADTVPRLRFSEFRDAPEWATRELSAMSTKIGSGITPTGGSAVYKTSGRPFIRSQNVGWGHLILDDVAFIDEEMHGSFVGTELRSLDVLLNITGASIGRSAVADERIVGGNVNQHVCVIRTMPAELNPLFLNQFLISERGQRQIDSFQAGGNRQGLNYAQIRSLQIPIPPTEGEQKRIADALTSVDTLINAQRRNLDALQTHNMALMQQLFPLPEEST